MHVAHLFGSFGPGGAEMGALRLIRSLPDLQHTVLSIGSDVRLAREAGIACRSLGLDGPSRAAGLHVARLCKGLGVDIIHVNNLAPWPDAAVAGLLAGAGVVQTFHGVEQAALRFPVHKRLVYQALAMRSRALIAVAQPAADLLCSLTGIPAKRVRVIVNGVDTAEFHPAAQDKAGLKASLGLPEEGVLLGCVAALRPVKDHAGLLRALAAANAQRSQPCFLALVGDGPLEADLRGLAAELDLTDSVHFLGRRKDVPELLRAFDAFVLNSETEGLSYAVLEAMASGLPVLASRVGANPELIADGEQGWLYGKEDQAALVRLLAGVTLQSCLAMGAAARRKVEQGYSLRAMAQAYAAVYASVLERA